MTTLTDYWSLIDIAQDHLKDCVYTKVDVTREGEIWCTHGFRITTNIPKSHLPVLGLDIPENDLTV